MGPDFPIRIREAREFLFDNCCGDLRLRDLAQIAGCSQFHFHRLYSDAFGETPHQALTRKRVQQAERLLRSGGYSVQEVCIEVGFTSLSSFSHLFKRYTDVTPAEYRRVFACPQAYALKVTPACFFLGMR